MWWTTDEWLACAIGMIAGFLISAAWIYFSLKSVSGDLKKTEEQRERNDPANYWKYGGDPFGHLYKDDQDDDRVA
jgi:uncharacterized membrane-anchored protein YhcB (DUF1043 family)